MNENQFERVTGYEDADLPRRKTEYAAGYDMKPYESGFVMPGETKLIKTGIKCRINYDEHIQMHLRSSVGINNDVMLANGTGIIDADYYNNKENEGHIMIPLRNIGKTPFEYKSSERLVQLLFMPYRITAKDTTTDKRHGGFGSTGV
nr:MAG TPA: deoxyuridine 5'-triphosphate nucleotidohydrolase [Caudoviricetes sp.]